MSDERKHIYTHITELVGHRSQPTFLEIGCHRMEDTTRLLELLSNPNYHCFEPDPRNAAATRAHMDSRIQLHEVAISDYIGIATMYLSGGTSVYSPNREWTASSSILPPAQHLTDFPHVQFPAQTQVAVTTLDEFYRQYGLTIIDFIWADVQGAEGHLVRGGQSALAHTRYLYSEYGDREWYKGQIPLAQWLKMLPGQWEQIDIWDTDVLLHNLEYK